MHMSKSLVQTECSNNAQRQGIQLHCFVLRRTTGVEV